MGVVYQQNKGLVAAYKAEVIKWPKALVAPGKMEAEVTLATLSGEEVERILLKLDALALSTQHEGIAKMVAEEVESILIAIRMVKTETKAEFAGLLGAGPALDIEWLRAKEIGAAILDSKAAVATEGPWQNGIYSWLQTVAAPTADYIIDPQTISEEAGLIHLGAIDPIEVPKIGAVSFEIAGIATPAQTCPFNLRRGFGNQALPFVRWEKPVIIGPETLHAIQCYPNISGDTKMQLLSFIIARAQDLTL